jgi:threonine dehydrogenase-like Zn-dependent dehydrogenase
MCEKMKAFVMKSIGKVGFMEKPAPTDPGPDDAIIKTIRALVCTSDAHTVAGAIDDGKNLALRHEAVGIVY